MQIARPGNVGRLVGLSAALGRADSVEAAAETAVQMSATAFDGAVAAVWSLESDTPGPVAASAGVPDGFADRPRPTPDGLLGPDGTQSMGATAIPDPPDRLWSEVLVSAGDDHVLSLGSTGSGTLDHEDETVLTGIATALGTTVESLRDERSPPHAREGGTAGAPRQRVAAPERYETIVEAVGDPVYALDEEGRFTFVNDAARRAFGYGEDVLGEHVSVGMAAADIDRVREQIRTLLATDRRSATSQFEIETADGDRRTVENHLALADPEGPSHTVGVLRDVTEREDRCRQLESFRRAIEEAADGVAVLEDGEYVHVDTTHVEMYGLDSKADLLGETWRLLYDEEEVERLVQEAFPVLEAEGHWQGAVTGTRPDGTTFPAALSLTRLGDDRLVCTVRDETETVERQRDLALKERAMDEASVGIRVVDPTREGNPVVYVNDGFEEITGHDRATVRGADLWSVQRPDPETLATVETAIDAGDAVSTEIQATRPDGETYRVALSLTPVHDDGGALTHYIGIQQDITDRRERELAQEAAGAAFERIYRVTTDPELDFDEKVDELLAAGREYLDLPNGFLTRIDPDEDGKGTQTVVGARGSHDLLQEGESCPLPRSYCRKTIGSEELMTVTNAAETGWEGDPAHDTFGLETYIGGEVAAGGTLYGTLCFASETARETPFTEREQSFVRLLRRWAGYEIERERARTELRQQRERLELVLSGTGTGIVEWDPQTDAVSWDDTLTELVGRDPTSIEAFVECLHPDDRDRVQERMATMLETGEPWNGTFRLYTGSDEVAWLETRAVPVYEDGDPVQVLATGTDVTREKRDERERRRNERRFQSLLADPDTLVGLLDTDGTMLDANETALSYVDADREDVLGEPLPETPWWTDSDTAPEDVREWVRRAADGEYVEFSTTHPGPDGDRRHVTGSLRPVTGASGAVESLVVSSRDVTERRRQQRELRDRQRKLDLALTNTDTSVVEVDLETGAMFWDERLGEDDIGSPETLASFLDIVHPDDRARVRSDIGALSDSADRLDGEYRVEDESGEYRWVASQAVPVEEGSSRAVAIATDITELKRRERTLAENRERFELLLESVDEYAFMTVDGDGRVDTWNEGARNLFGYDAETAVGTSTRELYPDEESGVADRLLEQARLVGESAHEGTQVRADGSTFYADVRYATLESDEFEGYAVVVRDMTERRRQRRRTELFVEESDDVVAVLDPDGTVTYASGSAERVLGRERDQLVGQNIFDHVHPNDREKSMERFYTSVEESTDIVRTECRLRSGDGEWLNVEAGCRNMLDTDAIDGILVYIRDVTDRKERIRRLDAVFNGTFQFTGLLEPDGTVVEVNDAALDFGGFDRASVVGERFADVGWWTHSTAVHERVERALETAAAGEFVRYETEVRGADGLRTVDFSAKPVTDEDGEVSMLVVEGRDITAQHQSSQHMQVIHRLMRHNMRNDLNKVRSWTELLVEEDDPERRAEQFARVEPTLTKWEQMTDMFHQIRQVMETPQALEPDTDAAELLTDAVSECGREHPDATAETSMPDTGTPLVPSLLAPALQELLENAVQASDGPAHVEATLSRPDEDWVVLAVTDDGPGMPEMEATVLETGEETQLAHGSGLGLWMVRMLVTGAGGDITVDVTDDGTSVQLRLPTD